MTPAPRYHFLDGLRGIAMLVGIFFHAAMSFMGYPNWWAQDVRADPASFGVLVDLVHASRMPLFFLVSGFFTAMMWQKRGLRSLVKQRLLRIGVPLVAGTILLTPLMGALKTWGERVKEENRIIRLSSWDGMLHDPEIWTAVAFENHKKVERLLKDGADPSTTNKDGTPSILLAGMLGHTREAQLLIDYGADVDQRGVRGNTALMSAAFFGRVETVAALLKADADTAVTNHKGQTPMDAATMDFEIVEATGKMLSIPVNEEMQTQRDECAELIRKTGAVESDQTFRWYWKGVFKSVFYHLWFLYYLLWLLAIFVPVVWLWQKTGKTMPDLLVKSPWCLIALVPLTFWAQLGMPESYGPGTATGIFPWGAKLGYYAIFFFFGALAFGRGWWEQKAGTRWWLWLLAALPLFIVTRAWIYTNNHYYAQMGVSLLTWLLLIGLFGFFRRFLNGGHPIVRYLSDASYWLYLGHFPMIVTAQILMQNWEISAWLKFSLMSFGVTGILLVIYQYAVRYTWIGALLNGRRALPKIKP